LRGRLLTQDELLDADNGDSADAKPRRVRQPGRQPLRRHLRGHVNNVVLRLSAIVHEERHPQEIPFGRLVTDRRMGASRKALRETPGFARADSLG
jgi:hypothetical protein